MKHPLPLQQVPTEDIFPLLTFIHFSYLYDIVIHWLFVSCCRACFARSGLTYHVYSGGGPCTYVYCVVSYHVIATPYARSDVVSLHTATLLVQNTLWTMRSLNSLKYLSKALWFMCHRTRSPNKHYKMWDYCLFALFNIDISCQA